MAIGSKELAPVELDTFEDERLLDELKKAKEELFNLRFQAATGQLDSHGRLRAVKRDIARVYTVIRERELGLRATPAPIEVVEKPAKKATKAKAKAKDAAEAAPAEVEADAESVTNTEEKN
jgi:large subunit ribosomal protein L29